MATKKRHTNTSGTGTGGTSTTGHRVPDNDSLINDLPALGSSLLDTQYVRNRYSTELGYDITNATHRMESHQVLCGALRGDHITFPMLASRQKLGAPQVGQAIHDCYGSPPVTDKLPEHRLSHWLALADTIPEYQNRTRKLDLISCYFMPETLTGNHLNATLAFSLLEGQKWEHISADGSAFFRATILDGAFDHSDFNGCNFNHAVCEETKFNQCQLQGATFQNAILRDVTFSHTDLSQTDFTNTRFENVIIGEGCTLPEAWKQHLPFGMQHSNTDNITKLSDHRPALDSTHRNRLHRQRERGGHGFPPHTVIDGDKQPQGRINSEQGIELN